MALERLLRFFSSLRLTVVCLGLAVLLVFFGTLAQVDEGLYAAQSRWFRSFLVVNARLGWLPVPVFPGGYLIGGVLLVNLVMAHAARFRLSWRNSGLLLAHSGLILLLLGQLFTDMFAVESAMRLEVGETRNYSEDFSRNELVVIDTTDPGSDRVVAIPESVVARGGGDRERGDGGAVADSGVLAELRVDRGSAVGCEAERACGEAGGDAGCVWGNDR